MDQNINFSGSDQIQTPQYPEIHPPSQEKSDEVFQANDSVQNKENLENSSSSNQEQEIPPQDSDMHQLIEECSIEICAEQKQSMEDTMLELVKICQEKEFLCIHDDVDDLIEKSDEVTESNVENLLPIPSKCEVTLEDKRECDLPISENSPIYDDHSNTFSDSKIDDDISVYDDDFEDIEYVEASISDPQIVNVEEENEEADLFLAPDNSIPPGIENCADDPERDIRFLEKLLIDDSILSHESSSSNFEDNPSISRPPPEPPDAETDAGEEIRVVMNDKDEDVDYSSFIFISVKVFSFLSAKSEDTIFDPGISD
nr:hypothetical protein [Tanacetum cinerariifolium]